MSDRFCPRCTRTGLWDISFGVCTECGCNKEPILPGDPVKLATQRDQLLTALKGIAANLAPDRSPTSEQIHETGAIARRAIEKVEREGL